MRIPSVQQRYWSFNGGLDQVSPPIQKSPGFARAALNFECNVLGGYSRVKGYECFDGQASPSDAQYHILSATITGSPVVGNTLTGSTSAASGKIIAIAETYFVLTKVSGTYSAGENLNVGGPTIAVATDTNFPGSATTSALNASYLNLAADVYRADIAAVPGSGNILGVIKHNNIVYAFRNNAGGTAAAIYKSSSSGWVSVPLGREVSFTSGGTTVIAEGNTVTGATSAATAVVKRVVLISGSWAGGDAAGRLILSSQTGTLQAENLNIGASLNVATISGNSSAIALAPSGRYELVAHNFGGTVNTRRIYGCDGVNRAFEFDGTDYGYVPISTGMSTDTPKHIAVQKNHLFLSFGASAQHSGTGEPYVFTIITGAQEIAVGDTITGFLVLPGSETSGAMAIYCRNATKILYGNDSTDWLLATYSEEAGALEWTQQFIGTGLVLDDQGLTTLATTQQFGNFKSASITDRVDPSIRGILNTAVASTIIRAKNQYRLFFTGGSGLYVTMNGAKVSGIMPVTLADPVACIWSGESGSGEEEVFYGSTNGMVYQMEVGTSFDGDAIDWLLAMSFNHLGSPRVMKSFRGATVEITGDSYVEYYVSHRLAYGQTAVVEQPSEQAATLTLSATNWDSGNWDSGFYDATTLAPQSFDVVGDGENISLRISGSSDQFDAFTVNGAVVDFIPRRTLRP